MDNKKILKGVKHCLEKGVKKNPRSTMFQTI